MSRRSDGPLRHAISVLERMLLTDPSPEMVIERSLSQLMLLLDAKFGYAFQCLDAPDEEIPWELVSSYNIVEGIAKEKLNSSTSAYIPSPLRTRLLSGRCMHGGTQDVPILPLPHDHPAISNFYCIPLVDALRIYGVLFLCNVSDGFSEGLELRLRPFIAAASCLLRTSEKKRQFQQRAQSLQAGEHPEQLLGLLDTMFNGVLVVNADDNVTMCNKAAASMLSLPQRDIMGTALSVFLPAGAPQIESRLVLDQGHTARGLGGQLTVWRGVPALKGNGQEILVDLSAFEINTGRENLRGIVLDDISDRMQSASDYHATLQRFQVLTNVAPIAILQLNSEWECTYANDTWCEYCQMTPDEAKGLGWMKGLYTSDADKILENLYKETAQLGKYEGEFRLQSPLRRVTWIRANACSLYTESGETVGLIITFIDITEHRSSERRLREIAERDQLTGLVNRAFFNDRLEVALKGISRFGSVALMFLDLDEFKHINDTLGHESGDKLLQDIAIRLQDILRQVDTIARIGGDEFTVLLTNVHNTRSITAIADKLLGTLAEPFVLNNRPIYVTCSIGIAVAETDGAATSKQLLKQADVALYKAKGAGRNQYRFYTAELDKNADLHIHLRHSLKEAGRNDFRVVYQPQVDASSGEIVGLEALTRWAHPNMDAIGPDIFIKMIEESGMVDDFTLWLFEDVFSTMNHWLKMPECNQNIQNIKVSINLSAKQFRNHDLALYIEQRCRAYGISPCSVVLEMTETALIDDPGIAATTLKKLRELGFGIALDDFGTGYSSLVYLRNMPLECVKIDRSFIKDVIHDEEDAKIVSAILALAATLELDVIAEGVDNIDVKNWLVERNCPIQQGFYFYKPLERFQIEELLILQAKNVSNRTEFREEDRLRGPLVV